MIIYEDKFMIAITKQLSLLDAYEASEHPLVPKIYKNILMVMDMVSS